MSEQKSKTELLSELYAAENAVKAYYPYATAEETAKNALTAMEASRQSSRNYRRGFRITALILLAIKILFYIWSQSLDSSYDLSGALLRFFALDMDIWRFTPVMLDIFGLLFLYAGIIFGILSLVNGSLYRRRTARLPGLQEKLQQASAARAQKEAECQVGLRACLILMPEECLDPRYARVFIRYIETDQAETLGAARTLFDEYLHRERMEQLAKEQIQAAREAAEAARRAEAAARAAANAANNSR